MTQVPTLTAHGATIPRLGLGTWPAKGEEASRAVETAIRAGYRHIDTAAMYANEAEVGAGIRAAGVARDALFVTTKVWRDDLAAGALQRSAEASLRKLGLDQVDLLLIHWPNDGIPLAESIGALCETKKRGLARHIGVSNFTVALLDEAWRHASEPLVLNQCEYHPGLDQSAVLAACRRYGMAFTSYSPVAKGMLADDPVMREIAARHGRTIAQVALRWHMQQPDVIAIPKSVNAARIRENFSIFDFALSEAEMTAIFALARADGRLIRPAWEPVWDGPA